MYMYYFFCFFCIHIVTCSLRASLNIYRMLNHTVSSNCESWLYQIYKPSINVASLIGVWPQPCFSHQKLSTWPNFLTPIDLFVLQPWQASPNHCKQQLSCLRWFQTCPITLFQHFSDRSSMSSYCQFWRIYFKNFDLFCSFYGKISP